MANESHFLGESLLAPMIVNPFHRPHEMSQKLEWALLMGATVDKCFQMLPERNALATCPPAADGIFR